MTATFHDHISRVAKNAKTIIALIRSLVLTLLALTSFVDPTLAQEVNIPDPGLNAAIRAALQKPIGPLTQQDLLSLTNLDASNRDISSVEGLEAAHNLATLGLFNNHLTSFVLSNRLPNLTLLDLGFNSLTRWSIPDGLTNLDTLFIEGNQLTNLTLPAGLTGLTRLDLSANGLTSFTFPADMTNLVIILIFANQLTNVAFPPNLSRLSGLDLDFNHFLTLNLPAGLTNLSRLNLVGSQLTNLAFPAGLANLTFLDLRNNRLTDLTLPSDLAALTSLFLNGNPLTTLVLSEPLAATNLAVTVASLRTHGVSVFTYPVAVQLLRPRTLVGAFQFGVTGPPGVYTILESSDLAAWSVLGAATNSLGSINFTDATAHLSPRKFYRVLLQTRP